LATFVPGSVPVTVNVPVCAPAVVGVKATSIEQLESAASVAVQAFDSVKPELAEIPIEVRFTPPVLLRVTVCAGENWLVMVLGKLNALAESMLVGEANPIPLSVTVCGELEALSVKLSEPEADPV
jgi:hypothetical protein